MIVAQPKDFADWRALARTLLRDGVSPETVVWASPGEELLFPPLVPAETAPGAFKVPRNFIQLATRAGLHRDPGRWTTLYRVLWRIVNETSDLLRQSTDPDVLKIRELEGEVRRDCHKMKAFVRFRKNSEDEYVAWYEPGHLIVKAVAPFFARRFSSMNWCILTPDCSVYWDQNELRFGPGLSRSHAPSGDEMEELWKTYYAHIFNPARVKISAMLSEMPKKHWKNLPETAIIGQLLKEAPQRRQAMLEDSRADLAPHHAVSRALSRNPSLSSLRKEAASCRGCELCHTATQTVFGSGPNRARVVIIGEQPGEQEDRQGKPFVGPAGQLLRRCLKRINIDEKEIYFTNVVKHFRWEPDPRGSKKRLHKRATWRQIDTCEPWVTAEIQLIKPDLILLLGSTALQSLVDRQYQISQCRGRPLSSPLAPLVVATVHPSSLLRMRDNREQQREIDRFCRDLDFAFTGVRSDSNLYFR